MGNKQIHPGHTTEGMNPASSVLNRLSSYGRSPGGADAATFFVQAGD